MPISDLDAVLLGEIDVFMKEFGMSPSAFGSDALDDPNFVFDMREREKPRSPSGRTVAKVRDFMARKRREKANSNQFGEGAPTAA